uniref:Uncharacterized protein n=1 Tax=Serratia marcescens TaxID=615 RepID=A0A345IPC7_SERMA|nr:hypothetical protein [Serratia marcescens]
MLIVKTNITPPQAMPKKKPKVNVFNQNGQNGGGGICTPYFHSFL